MVVANNGNRLQIEPNHMSVILAQEMTIDLKHVIFYNSWNKMVKMTKKLWATVSHTPSGQH